MEIIDFTSGGLVYRWILVAGQPRCVENCLPPLDNGALPALQRNAAIRTALPPVIEYEAAQVLVDQGEPDNGEPMMIHQTDEDGVPDINDDGEFVMISNPAWALLPRTVIVIDPETGEGAEQPEPRWAAYDVAVALIAGASPVVKAFALWRQPEPAEGDDGRSEWLAAGQIVGAAIDDAAETPLEDDPRPLPIEVSVRQFAQACALLGHISAAEALEWATRRALPAQMEAMLDSIPEQYRWEARMLVEGASTYQPSNDFVSMFAIVANITEAQQFAIWRLAATL